MTRFGSRRRFGCSNSSGFTLIELLIVVAIIGVIAAIAVPSLLKARISADEAGAIAALRAINSAQSAYASSAGNGGYAVTLVTLSQACPNSSNGFIGPDLAQDPVVRNGYRLTLAASASSVAAPADCNGVTTRTGFYTTATPVTGGVTGHSAYASSTSSVVFLDRSGVPPTEAAMALGGGGEVAQ